MKPMNLMIIMDDEHSQMTMGCYGHPIVKTPNLDRLAASGTRFENVYTNCPICTPARASFATGKYVHEIGYWDNATPYDGRVPGWGHRLQESGVRNISIGKLHYRNETDPTGIDEQIIPMHARDGGVGDILGSIRDELPVRESSKSLAVQIGAGETSYSNYDLDITERACQWLENEAAQYGERPWMLYVSFVSPHYPLIAPQEFFEMYPPEEMPLPKPHATDGRPLHPWIEAFRICLPSDDPFDDEKRRIAIASYFGLCSFVDRNVGLVLTSLEEAGLADSTRVIFASDHGESLGSRGMWGKGTMYEEAAAVPLIISGPDIPAGKVVTTPVSLADFYPTILESVGVALNEDDKTRPGRSLYEIAAEPDDSERTVFSEYHAAGAKTAAYMLRRGKYKYIHYVDFRPELFDLEADPEELNDLAPGADYGETLKEFEAALREIVDPEAVDLRAKADQAALIERHGGREAVMNWGHGGATPTPGDYHDDEY
jgi:choline-sulfatase